MTKKHEPFIITKDGHHYNREDVNCTLCKNFLEIGICNYSDMCEDFDYFEPRKEVIKVDGTQGQ